MSGHAGTSLKPNNNLSDLESIATAKANLAYAFTDISGDLADSQLSANVPLLDAAGQTFTGNLNISGVLTVGEVSTVLDVQDRVIHVNHSTGANDPVPALVAGLSVHRGSIASVSRDHSGLFWDEVASKFKLALNTAGDDSTLGAYVDLQAKDITAASFTGSATGLTGVPDSALSSNIPLKNGSNTFSNYNQIGSTAAQIGAELRVCGTSSSFVTGVEGVTIGFNGTYAYLGHVTGAAGINRDVVILCEGYEAIRISRKVAGGQAIISNSVGTADLFLDSATSMRFNIDTDNNVASGHNFIWGNDREADSGGTELMRLTDTGFLGIGKTPGTALDVNGTVTATTFSGSGASLTSVPDSALSSNVPLKNAANTFAASQTIGDGYNLVFGATTGTKIGTATTQKLAFYNSTPIVQPTGSVITALTNLGLVATPTIAQADVASLVSDLSAKAPLSETVYALGAHSGSGSLTIDWANGRIQTCAASANITSLVMSNPTAGNAHTLIIAATGAVDVTLPSFYPGSSGTVTIATGKSRCFSLLRVGSAYYCAYTDDLS